MNVNESGEEEAVQGKILRILLEYRRNHNDYPAMPVNDLAKKMEGSVDDRNDLIETLRKSKANKWVKLQLFENGKGGSVEITPDGEKVAKDHMQENQSGFHSSIRSLQSLSKTIRHDTEDLKSYKEKCNDWQLTYPHNPNIVESIKKLESVQLKWQEAFRIFLNFPKFILPSKHQMIAYQYQADYQQLKFSGDQLIDLLESIKNSGKITSEIEASIGTSLSIFFHKSLCCLSHIDIVVKDKVD
ncbi:MAG: hypothetical protein AAGG51_07645 [Cyanobacteria bacterium P01_G01_bin.54]